MAEIDQSAPLVLDKPRTLRLDIEALCSAEKDLSLAYGRDISVYEVLVKVPMRLNDLCIILLHGLEHEDHTLTLPQVKRLLNEVSMLTVFRAISDAWAWQTRAAEPQETTPAMDPPPAAPIGDDSGPLPALSLGSGSGAFGA
jgi:hypothetical protein